MPEPIVSVCIPAYQGAEFISKSIESVREQTFSDFELIVSDDCSQDNTLEIVRSYARQDERIVCVSHETNIGMVNNWNQCLSLARGRYIKFLFQDDILASADSLDKMVEILDANENVSLVAAARKLMDQHSRVLETSSFFPGSGMVDGRSMVRYCLMKHGNVIGEPSAVLFRKDQARRGFDPRYRQIVDLEMWFHLLEQGEFAYLNEPLCGFRIHQGQQTAKNLAELAHMEDYNLLFAEYLERSCFSLGSIDRNHIKFHQFHNIWRLSRGNPANRRLALAKITRYYGACKFFVTLPLYKLYNPFFKYMRSRFRKRIFRVLG